MISTRRSAVLVGLLSLPATITGVLDGADYLIGISANANALTAGVDH
jgi:hypothetical protein